MNEIKSLILSDAIQSCIEAEKKIIRYRRAVIGLCAVCVFLACIIIVR